jgi:phosphoglycerate dehydrogenase-like enzyme
VRSIDLKKNEIGTFLEETIVGIKGAGDIATGVAVRLKRSGYNYLYKPL